MSHQAEVVNAQRTVSHNARWLIKDVLAGLCCTAQLSAGNHYCCHERKTIREYIEDGARAARVIHRRGRYCGGSNPVGRRRTPLTIALSLGDGLQATWR